MRVGIDCRCLPVDGSSGAGVAHAARFLISELASRDVPWEWRVYLPNGAGSLDIGYPWTSDVQHIEMRDASGRSLRAACKEHPCDILFVPSGACAPGITVPQIPWVHDLAIFDHPEWFPETFLRRQITTRLFARGLRRAPILFAVSEETKNQIGIHLGIDPKMIIVTHEGGDPALSTREKPIGTPDRFCLAVGTVEPRKNFEMLDLIWPEIYKKSGRRLVIVGKVGWGNVRINASDAVRIKENIDDEEKRYLMSGADIVLVPSRYEGFGLVALEAMQARTAIIASDRGALPEVVGNGGLLIPPDQPEQWKKEIIRLLSDDHARRALAEVGERRAEAFSWKTTADIIVNEIKKLPV